MFRIGLKNVMARKFRLLSSGLAVILGVGFMAGGLVLTDTISKTFDDLFADVFAGTDAVVRTSEAFENDFGDDVRARVPADLVEVVAKAKGVARAEGSVFGVAQVVGKDGEVVGNAGQGAPSFGGNWSEDKELNAFHIVDGRAPRADDEIVLDRKSALDGELAVGDRTTTLTKAGPTEVTLVGIAKFGDLDSAGGSGFVGFTDAAAQRLVAEPGKYDSIVVAAEEGVSQEELRDSIAAALPESYEAITGEEVTKENQDSIQESLSFFGIFITVFTGISLFVGSFIIYNTFSILVAQRRREMGLMRAVGATGGQVMMTLLLEALVIGVLASVVGLVIGVGIAMLLKAVLDGFGFELPATGVVVTASTAQVALLTGTVITVLAAVLPARRAANVPPIAALRDSAVDSTSISRSRVAISLAVTGVGVALLFFGLLGDGGIKAVGFGVAITFIGVTITGPVVARHVTGFLGLPLARYAGVAGALGRENAMRNPKRTARTASALLIGVALVGFIAIVTTSVKASFEKVVNEQFTGDFVIGSSSGPGGGIGVSPALGEQLRGLDELDLVASLRFTPARFDGEETGLPALNAVEAGEMFDIGVVEGSMEDLGDDGVAVFDEYAKDQGWKIGTTLPVEFPGTEERTLRVAAIYSNNEVAGNFFVGLPVLEASGADQFDAQLFATVAEGVEVDVAQAAVSKVLEAYPTAEVQTRQEFVEATGAFINPIIALIYVFLSLSVIIALVGIANTLALSVLERTRELGLLRAVGMTRQQLRRAVRYEAVLVALFGTLGGLMLGTFFGWAVCQALADEGFEVFKVPVFTLVIISVIAAISGVLAAIIPARRASRLDILKAIATD